MSLAWRKKVNDALTKSCLQTSPTRRLESFLKSIGSFFRHQSLSNLNLWAFIEWFLPQQLWCLRGGPLKRPYSRWSVGLWVGRLNRPVRFGWPAIILRPSFLPLSTDVLDRKWSRVAERMCRKQLAVKLSSHMDEIFTAMRQDPKVKPFIT